MQIQLKQSEIEQALKQYIAKKGFSLAGKDVSIAFTAGRKETGLTADVVIEDSPDTAIPGFTDSDFTDSIADQPPASIAGLKVVSKPTENTPEAVDQPDELPVPVTPTTSLFV